MSIFNKIQIRKPQKSAFNLSHTRKFSFDPGQCIPTLCQQVLPGDKWNYGMSALVRFQPMLAPIMHLVDCYNYTFFVPDRLAMQRNKFETFITGGKNGDGKDAQGNTIEIPYCVFNTQEGSVTSNTSLSFDFLTLGDSGNSDLADFLGIQTGITEFNNVYTFKINMMPFIHFWRIWNEYFRDENLHPDYVDLYPGIFDATGNITDALWTALTNVDTFKRMLFFGVPQVCWEKDYLTSALPFAQRGEPVETPLTGTATVTYKDVATVGGGMAGNDTQALGVRDGTNNINRSSDGTFDSPGQDTSIENIESVELTTGGFTINQLRLAARLQEWLEKMARGGSRYIEQIKAQFGVVSSDARLQRPEFLGGGKIPVHISEVLQTSEGTGTPLAEMAGHGVASGNINNFNRFFEEHGMIISVMFVRPKTSYQNGIARVFTNRFDKLDWPWPPFAHLGEQEVFNSEVYSQFTAVDEETFGYQSRYAEFKFIPSTVHGDFRHSLDFWHWGRIFESKPTLSKEFVQADPSARIFNVQGGTGQKMYCIVNNRITAIRPLPYFGTPTL